MPLFGLHSKSDYRGGWDKDRLNTIKKSGIKPHNLSVIYANVDVNWHHGINHIANNKSSIFDGIHQWANSKASPFSRMEISKDHIKSFLQAMGEGTNKDWLRDARETKASPEAVKRFLKDAEKIAWPEDWSTKNRSTGPEKMAETESTERNSYIIDKMGPGVYFAGSGHLLQIRDWLKTNNEEFDFHGGEHIEP